MDRKSAERVDHFAANSRFIADQISEYYGRPSTVIYPPADVEYLRPAADPRRDYLLAVGRMVPYKRLDLAIEAAVRTGRKLVVAGWGPEEHKLRSLADQLAAPGQVEFEIDPESSRLRDLYQHAQAVLFPSHEHFGIVPVEAQACGTQVIALGTGGALDTVVDGVTGIHVNEQSAAAFAEAIEDFSLLPESVEKCRTNALHFSHSAFIQRLRAWVEAGLDLRSETKPKAQPLAFAA